MYARHKNRNEKEREREKRFQPGGGACIDRTLMCMHASGKATYTTRPTMSPRLVDESYSGVDDESPYRTAPLERTYAWLPACDHRYRYWYTVRGTTIFCLASAPVPCLRERASSKAELEQIYRFSPLQLRGCFCFLLVLCFYTWKENSVLWYGITPRGGGQEGQERRAACGGGGEPVPLSRNYRCVVCSV